MEMMNAPTIQHFYNSLSKKGLSLKTAKIIHGVLSEALRQAVAIGYLRANPAEAYTLLRIAKKDIKSLDNNVSLGLVLFQTFSAKSLFRASSTNYS